MYLYLLFLREITHVGELALFGAWKHLFSKSGTTLILSFSG